MPKIDIAKLPVDSRSSYPEPFKRAVVGRERKRLGNAAGLDQFGVNLTRLRPGAASSLRHWHEKEDELVYILEGEVMLIEDDSETTSRAMPPVSRPTCRTAITWSTNRDATRFFLKSAHARNTSAPSILIWTW